MNLVHDPNDLNLQLSEELQKDDALEKGLGTACYSRHRCHRQSNDKGPSDNGSRLELSGSPSTRGWTSWYDVSR